MEMLINLLIHNVQILALVINWLKPVSRLQKNMVCSLFAVWSGLLTSRLVMVTVKALWHQKTRPDWTFKH